MKLSNNVVPTQNKLHELVRENTISIGGDGMGEHFKCEYNPGTSMLTIARRNMLTGEFDQVSISPREAMELGEMIKDLSKKVEA